MRIDGQKLREARDLRGQSQIDVAEQSGHSVKSISNAERIGKTTAATLLDILQAINELDQERTAGIQCPPLVREDFIPDAGFSIGDDSSSVDQRPQEELPNLVAEEKPGGITSAGPPASDGSVAGHSSPENVDQFLGTFSARNDRQDVVRQQQPGEKLDLGPYQQSRSTAHPVGGDATEQESSAAPEREQNEQGIPRESGHEPIVASSQSHETDCQAETEKGTNVLDSHERQKVRESSFLSDQKSSVTADNPGIASSDRSLDQHRTLISIGVTVTAIFASYLLLGDLFLPKRNGESATVYADTETLHSQTDFSAELIETQTSFDLLANNAGIIKHYWDKAIRDGLERGVRFRIVLSDYRAPASPGEISRFQILAADVDAADTETSQREVAKTTHESLDRLLGDIALDSQLSKPKYSGSLEIRWNQKFLFNTLWLRDAHTDFGFGHIGIHFRQGKSKWPNFRFSKSEAPELLENSQKEFELIWKEAVRYESVPLDVQ
ncbi:MAG: hypothetical protein ABJZ55_16545 [Fuerstiella sp.]